MQRALAPKGLAIKVMQSSNIFTVGGTLSANAHGRDLDVMQVVDVVERFHLLHGERRDRRGEPHRAIPISFSLAIGGYGMCGVILDVTLRVTRDELYEQRAEILDYKDFPRYFSETVQHDPQAVLMLARPSIDPDPSSFLREIAAVTWRHAPKNATASFALTEEANVTRDRFFFGLSRTFDWAKSLRWSLQKRVELGAGDAQRDVAQQRHAAAARAARVPRVSLLERHRHHPGVLRAGRALRRRSWTSSAGSSSTAG